VTYTAPHDTATVPIATGLSTVLLESLETLAKAGKADLACQQAGRACAVLRERDMANWKRFNALLHRLVRQLPS
jgi:hypothetical protein